MTIYELENGTGVTTVEMAVDITDCPPGVCPLCWSVATYGWWGANGVTHCQDTHHTWKLTQTRQAHCETCHRHFSSPSAFDLHLKKGDQGGCRPPAELVKDGKPLLIETDGMWAFPPVEGGGWWKKDDEENGDVE